MTQFVISSSNHMFGRAIRDKLPECVSENFENFVHFFKNHEGDLSQKSPQPNMWLLINHTKPTKTLYWNFSRSHHHAQLGNALQKFFFAYSALIMDTLKGSIIKAEYAKKMFLEGISQLSIMVWPTTNIF